MEIPRLPVVYSPASLGVPYEDVAFKSRGDNVTLKGWFVPGSKRDVILIVHGGFQNRIDDNVDTGGLTHALVEKGHNVLLFDLRGRGESEGRGLSLSNIGPDIGGAVDYLESRGFSTDNICILGFCSGAAATCIYASENSVGAIILDGLFYRCAHDGGAAGGGDRDTGVSGVFLSCREADSSPACFTATRWSTPSTSSTR